MRPAKRDLLFPFGKIKIFINPNARTQLPKELYTHTKDHSQNTLTPPC